MSGAVIKAVKVGASGAEAALDALISAEDFAGVVELCEATAGQMPFAEEVEGLFRARVAKQWPRGDAGRRVAAIWERARAKAEPAAEPTKEAEPPFSRPDVQSRDAGTTVTSKAEPKVAEAAAAPMRLRRFNRKIGEPKAVANGEGAAADFAGRLGAAIAGRAKPEPEPDVADVADEAEPEPKTALPALIPPTALVNWDPAVLAMNEQHAVIESVGGKTVIASWEPNPINLNRMMVVYQNKDSFLLRYSNKTVPVVVASGTRSVPLGQWWLGHPDRRQFRGVTFLPGGPGVVSECLNLWQGWGVVPRPGDWGLIKFHVDEVLAGGVSEFAEYILRWVAWSIQHPAEQAEVALVLIGEKGVGKGTLVRCLQRIFGAHAFQVTTREHVIDKFNGHLQDCVLFIADEAYWGGDKRCVGRLQGMITEPTLSVERKGIDTVEVPNFLHMLMLAEPGWVIPAGRFERRYAAFAVSATKRADREYFRALHHQITDGGAEAMMWDLQRMDLDGWHPREIPEALLKSKTLQEQQAHTLAPWEQWFFMLLHTGKLPGASPKRPNVARTVSLVANAQSLIPRLKFEASVYTVRSFLLDAKRTGLACKKFEGSQFNGWEFLPLAEHRRAWERLYGTQLWDADVDEWIG
jgi:ABC-type cobalamin/Fe3+-siderophores transport system ATPase subunit